MALAQDPRGSIPPLQVVSIDREMLKKAPPIYIYNTSTKPYFKDQGGLGMFIIPGRKEGERVSAPLELTGIIPEQVNTGDVVIPNYIDGDRLARSIVGLETSLPTKHEYTTNLEWLGVFISKTKPPSEAEIKAAEDKRKEWLLYLVDDGDRRALLGDGDNGLGGLTTNHRMAVHELNMKRTWAERATLQDECENCGQSIKSKNIAACPHCQAIVNMEAYKKAFPAKYLAHMEAIKQIEAAEEQKEAPKPTVERGKPLYDRKNSGQ